MEVDEPMPLVNSEETNSEEFYNAEDFLEPQETSFDRRNECKEKINELMEQLVCSDDDDAFSDTLTDSEPNSNIENEIPKSLPCKLSHGLKVLSPKSPLVAKNFMNEVSTPTVFKMGPMNFESDEDIANASTESENESIYLPGDRHAVEEENLKNIIQTSESTNIQEEKKEPHIVGDEQLEKVDKLILGAGAEEVGQQVSIPKDEKVKDRIQIPEERKVVQESHSADKDLTIQSDENVDQKTPHDVALIRRIEKDEEEEQLNQEKQEERQQIEQEKIENMPVQVEEISPGPENEKLDDKIPLQLGEIREELKDENLQSTVNIAEENENSQIPEDMKLDHKSLIQVKENRDLQSQVEEKENPQMNANQQILMNEAILKTQDKSSNEKTFNASMVSENTELDDIFGSLSIGTPKSSGILNLPSATPKQICTPESEKANLLEFSQNFSKTPIQLETTGTPKTNLLEFSENYPKTPIQETTAKQLCTPNSNLLEFSQNIESPMPTGTPKSVETLQNLATQIETAPEDITDHVKSCSLKMSSKDENASPRDCNKTNLDSTFTTEEVGTPKFNSSENEMNVSSVVDKAESEDILDDVLDRTFTEDDTLPCFGTSATASSSTLVS